MNTVITMSISAAAAGSDDTAVNSTAQKLVCGAVFVVPCLQCRVCSAVFAVPCLQCRVRCTGNGATCLSFKTVYDHYLLISSYTSVSLDIYLCSLLPQNYKII